ncbi:MAG: DUF3303 domain-containing protein [Candidatus Poribacteria bacterium]
MLFVGIADWEPAQRDEVIKRRKEWEYPENVKPIGEYTLLGANRAVVVFDASDITGVLGVELPYSDIVKWDITPAPKICCRCWTKCSKNNERSKDRSVDVNFLSEDVLCAKRLSGKSANPSSS